MICCGRETGLIKDCRYMSEQEMLDTAALFSPYRYVLGGSGAAYRTRQFAGCLACADVRVERQGGMLHSAKFMAGRYSCGICGVSRMLILVSCSRGWGVGCCVE